MKQKKRRLKINGFCTNGNSMQINLYWNKPSLCIARILNKILFEHNFVCTSKRFYRSWMKKKTKKKFLSKLNETRKKNHCKFMTKC